MDKYVTKTVLCTGANAEAKRQEIFDYYNATFELEEKLFELLKGESTFYLRPEPLRHPLIFYYGHTSTFLVNKLTLVDWFTERVNPAFEAMFAIGVDEMSWDDLQDTHYAWPAVADAKKYRDTVRDKVNELIKTKPLTLPITWDSPWWVILMGIEHARIHLETSSVLMRQLPITEVKPSSFWTSCPEFADKAPKNEMVVVAGETVDIGKKYDDAVYGWDNEYSEHVREVKPFKASKFLVSNLEYLEFVKDGGYDAEKYWTKEGWSWKSYRKAAHPPFWVPHEGTYKQRNLWEEVAMPWNWPVEVNYLEAKAFCNWKAEKTGNAIRLPSEEEWNVLRNKIDTDQHTWTKAPGNINLEYYASSCPVDKFEVDGIFDIIGNVWQHSETPINAFKGFRPHKVYDDFSVPTFDNKHNLIKGGSWIATGNEATKFARYAFRRHFFQHAGFRYVETQSAVEIGKSIYESDDLGSQYIEFHYGEEYYNVTNFCKALAQLCFKYTKDKPKKRALDLGCAVGRATFEIAREYEFVNGLDFSANFILIGTQMAQNAKLRWRNKTEGLLGETKETTLTDLDLAHVANKVEFMQADACNMNPKFANYDLVLAANLIDRLYLPRLFLDNVHKHMNIGGVLVITSPYTWLAEYTKVENWIGGYVNSEGKEVTTFEGLQQVLSSHFKLLGEQDVPFVIRETKRKYQHTLAHATVWERIK